MFNPLKFTAKMAACFGWPSVHRSIFVSLLRDMQSGQGPWPRLFFVQNRILWLKNTFTCTKNYLMLLYTLRSRISLISSKSTLTIMPKFFLKLFTTTLLTETKISPHQVCVFSGFLGYPDYENVFFVTRKHYFDKILNNQKYWKNHCFWGFFMQLWPPPSDCL